MAIKSVKGSAPFLFLLCAALFFMGCQDVLKNNSDAGDLEVQLPLPVQREDDPESLKQAYEYQIVKLLNVFEIKKVRGHYARFYLSPTLKEGRLSGVFPNADFVKNKKNVYTPANDISVQMASIYYHMQSLAQLDKALGAGEVNSWPRDIGLSVKVPQVSETGDLRLMENNAIYVGPFDAILFVPNRSDQLPIAVNGGILAHEHFHSLFFKLVTSKLKPLAENDVVMDKALTVHTQSRFQDSFEFLTLEENKPITPTINSGDELKDEELHMYYNSTLLQGLNEGLADFWGWMYTSDNNFIVHSLPAVSHGRSLKLNPTEIQSLTLPSQEKIIQEIKMFSKKSESFEGSLKAYAYALGTQFARNLRAFVSLHKDSRKISLGEAKTNVGKAVIQFLPKMAQEFVDKGKSASIDPNDLALKMLEGIPNLDSEECESVIKVLNRNKDSGHQLKCSTQDGKIKIQ